MRSSLKASVRDCSVATGSVAVAVTVSVTVFSTGVSTAEEAEEDFLDRRGILLYYT